MFNSNLILGFISVVVTMMFFGFIVFQLQSDKIEDLKSENRNTKVSAKVHIMNVEADAFTDTHKRIKDTMINHNTGVSYEINLSDGNHTITFGN